MGGRTRTTLSNQGLLIDVVVSNTDMMKDMLPINERQHRLIGYHGGTKGSYSTVNQ